MAESDFPDGCALVIGGSGGIGGVIAQRFAAAGSGVAITYRHNKERADKVAETINALGVKVTSHPVTVGDVDGTEATAEAAIAAHGRIHTVVYAAAMLTVQVDIADITHEQWNEAVTQDVNGFFNVVKATLPHMRAAGGGSYVNLGSAGHVWWPPKDALSVAPKGAIEALVRGIAKEEGLHDIRANSVLVGVIEAGMFLELSRQGVFDEAWSTEVQKNLCIKRWGKPEEIGDATVFLASRRAGYVTGQQLAVSGGFGI